MKRVFLVEVDVPPNVGVWRMGSYIKDAVGAWCGSMSPEDPLFDLDVDSVQVESATFGRVQRLLNSIR